MYSTDKCPHDEPKHTNTCTGGQHTLRHRLRENIYLETQHAFNRPQPRAYAHVHTHTHRRAQTHTPTHTPAPRTDTHTSPSVKSSDGLQQSNNISWVPDGWEEPKPFNFVEEKGSLCLFLSPLPFSFSLRTALPSLMTHTVPIPPCHTLSP